VEYAIEMCLGAMIYIPSFIQTAAFIQKLIREIHRQTDAAWRSHKPIFIFKNKESRLKIKLIIM
jgi:hypothetical protein